MKQLAASIACLPGNFEVIVADGGSDDRTVELARECGLRSIIAPRGRGPQMNVGAAGASGDVLLFLHADTRLPRETFCLIDLALQDTRVSGGNFGLLFDGGTRAAKILSKIYPLLRFGGMCYGDSAIFTRRAIFESLGGFRDFPIFEDLDLYRRLNRAGKFKKLRATAVTSSRRFEGRFIRIFALWSLLQVLYWLGVDPRRLYRFYHR
ncbi:MAG: glycosyltransferase family 2 protein [Acidobacteria bacterium]|nr:glycosyltransferase family 2 protein [Acidobacteriota bacterium]